MRALLLSLLVLAGSLCAAQVKVYPPEGEATGKIVVVSVHLLSEVTGPKVTLGEIADITADATTKAKLQALEIGYAPVAGIPRPIVASRIQAALMMAGLKTKDFQINLPSDAKIALKTQKIDAGQFVDAAKKAVQRQLGVEVPLQCEQSFPEFSAPQGELALEAGIPSKNQSGYSVLVSVTVAGKRINSRLINLTVDPSVSASAVKAGDSVKILIKNAGATIEVSGKARTGGIVGQQITVVANTGSIHQAIVIGAGQVEVKL